MISVPSLVTGGISCLSLRIQTLILPGRPGSLTINPVPPTESLPAPPGLGHQMILPGDGRAFRSHAPEQSYGVGPTSRVCASAQPLHPPGSDGDARAEPAQGLHGFAVSPVFFGGTLPCSHHIRSKFHYGFSGSAFSTSGAEKPEDFPRRLGPHTSSAPRAFKPGFQSNRHLFLNKSCRRPKCKRDRRGLSLCARVGSTWAPLLTGLAGHSGKHCE